MSLSFLLACGNRDANEHHCHQCDTIALHHAVNLTMVDCGEYTVAKFRNPWDSARTLQTFVLVPRDADLPDDLPRGTVIRTPLQRSIVYTSVHNSLLDELGAIDAVTGVCDAQYISRGPVRERIDHGQIADCGSSSAPNIEKILMLKPEAILLSAFENSNDHNKVGQTGIPIIDCIDYMESSPLGRAEWMRFFGRLYGKGAEADSIFFDVENSYNDIKALAANVEHHPIVLTEKIYGQTWDVPGANSTVGVLLEDAGAKNPFNIYPKSGSVQLAPEEVLYRAKDADFWLIKYAQASPLTLSQLKQDNPIYAKFKSWSEGSVYGLDTQTSTYFEDAAFHPNWVLAEYVELFHPELGPIENNHHYYQKLER